MGRTSPDARRVAGACLAAAIASCLALVALASAQGGSGDEQAITITARGGTATVAGDEGLRPGPARVTMRVAGARTRTSSSSGSSPGSRWPTSVATSRTATRSR